ncbi:MAG: preprotein translocase subunit SecE [Candidatus Delongbacteria bacterium]|nr:preprotein translocase subunit SecE [Candidatus Delongbacteria bacterium]
MKEKIQKFYEEIKKELSNVSWPKKEQIVGSTWIVIIVTVVLSLFLLVVDKVLEKAVILML